jgi:hypothetical protein
MPPERPGRCEDQKSREASPAEDSVTLARPVGKQIITFCKLDQRLLGIRVGVLGDVMASDLGTLPPVLRHLIERIVEAVGCDWWAQ